MSMPSPHNHQGATHRYQCHNPPSPQAPQSGHSEHYPVIIEPIHSYHAASVDQQLMSLTPQLIRTTHSNPMASASPSKAETQSFQKQLIELILLFYIELVNQNPLQSRAEQ